MVRKQESDQRVRQIFTGVAILLGLMVLVCGVLLGWGYLPGIWGEWIGTMVGVMTTPFFLEGSFIFIGFTVVIFINLQRRKREGEELVYLEQVEAKEGEAPLPEHAKWAIYQQKPLPGEEPPLLAQVEGALAIGDWQAAADAIAEIPHEMLKRRDVLEARIVLARETGKQELLARLEEELREASAHQA